MGENPKKLPQINENLFNQLRGLFFAKDRSLLISKNQVLGMATQNTPSSNPISPYLYVYPKADGQFYKLDSTGIENLIYTNTFGIELIRETILAAPVANVTFATIPQMFRHLMLFVNARTDRAGQTTDALIARFNADAGGNYDTVYLLGFGSAASSLPTAGATSINLMQITGATATANQFGGGYAVFNNYTNGNFRKTSTSESVNMADTVAANMQIIIRGNQWRSTNAITSITLLPNTGPNFVAGSIFQLYGIL